MSRLQQAEEDWRMAQRSEVERCGKRASLMLSLLRRARNCCSVEDMAGSCRGVRFYKWWVVLL